MSPAALSASASLLAADVGGTHVRMGLVEAGADGTPQVMAYAKYRCADHPGLDAIAAEFLADLGNPAVEVAVIASAGHVLEDGTLIANNLPWPLVPAALRAALDLRGLYLLNDFAALAHAVGRLGPAELLRLSGPAQGTTGPLLVLGPGTGLGAALWVPHAGRGLVLPTEAGQAMLAAATDLELELLRRLRGPDRHVPVERALSGPGLLNLYRALCALRGTDPVHAQPDAVTAAALDGGEPLARQALEVFCGLLGGVVGDLALVYGVQGVYLAGGILPRIAGFLAGSSFRERFLDKGPMRPALERVPVRLVEHGQLGVLGAACWYLDQAVPR